MLLKRYHISMLKIERVFISHLHGDHLFGLFGLLSSMALAGRTQRLYLYGPSQLEDVLRFYSDYFVDDPSYEMEFVKVSTDSKSLIYEDSSLEVEAFPLYHSKETYGYLFTEKKLQLNVRKEKIEQAGLSVEEIVSLKAGNNIVRNGVELLNSDFTYLPSIPRSFAYCSDTAANNRVAEYVSGVDLLYHEATFSNEFTQIAESRYHSTAAQAAGIAKQAQVGKLVIGHYSSRYDDSSLLLSQAREVFPETYAAETGMEFDIPLKNNFL